MFLPEINFESLLHSVVHQGWAFVPQALSRGFVSEMAAELEQAEFFEFFDESPPDVRQEFEVFDANPLPNPKLPLVNELRDKIGQLVRLGAVTAKTRKLCGWQPNDVAVQRYCTRTSGITRHRDYGSDILLVASFTVQGYANLAIYNDRLEGEACRHLATGPGSLVLLRAPGLVESGGDNRPVHSVGPPLSVPRVSVTYRLATKAKGYE